MSCSNCFTDYLSNCETEVNVFAQLEPLTEYTWIITDKFDKKYSGTVTTDADGFFDIDVADLPDGFLTQYSGDFTLEVQDSTCKPVKFKMASEYTCINFTVKGGTFTKSNLGCDFGAAAVS